ncbi:unnamed protein product, partial [Mesorhabditis spiculigera]
MFIMAIERSWSMWTAVTYEDSRSAAFSLCLYLGLVAYAITLVVLWYLEVIDATLVFLISYIIMFLACILFAVLPSICRRAHKTVTQARRVTLAQRFRAARNLQAARLLMYLSPYKCVTNLFSLCLYIAVFQQTEPRLRPLFVELYYYYSVGQCFLFMVLTCLLHDSLRETLIDELGFRLPLPDGKQPKREDP